VKLGRKVPLRVGWRIPLVFVGIHFGFAWGFWREVLKSIRESYSSSGK
jgi:succinoglycan biosynthesis protein ExoA